MGRSAPERQPELTTEPRTVPRAVDKLPRIGFGPRWRTWGWVVSFAVAFGWVEAAIVIYLRELYYPDGFEFPLVLMSTRLAIVELVRELATLVMLASVARAAARTGWGRFGLFAVGFGVWDIVYYVGLWGVLGWPESLATWDVLFLIPGIWTGPVWSAGLIAVLLVACGSVLYWRGERGVLPRATRAEIGLAAASLILLLGAFLANHLGVYAGGVPTDFPELVYVAGVVAGLLAFFDLLRRSEQPT